MISARLRRADHFVQASPRSALCWSCARWNTLGMQQNQLSSAKWDQLARAKIQQLTCSACRRRRPKRQRDGNRQTDRAENEQAVECALQATQSKAASSSSASERALCCSRYVSSAQCACCSRALSLARSLAPSLLPLPQLIGTARRQRRLRRRRRVERDRKAKRFLHRCNALLLHWR